MRRRRYPVRSRGGPGRRPRGRVSGRVCGRRSRSPSCGADLDALVVRPGRLAVQRRQARRSARHAPQLLQVVVDHLSGQPRTGGPHGGRAGLVQGAEDPGPYRVPGRLGHGGFSITASSSTAPESLRQKKLSRREMLSVGDRRRQGGRGNRRTLGNGLGSRRRWVPNASARKSHEAGFMSACDPRLVRSSARAARAVGAPIAHGVNRQAGPVELLGHAVRSRSARPGPRPGSATGDLGGSARAAAVAGAVRPSARRRRSSSSRGGPSAPTPTGSHVGRGPACEPAPGTGRQPAAAVSASRAPAWVRQSVWLGPVPAQRSPRALRELRSSAHSESACFWT
ncbi:hypothetical protein OK006_5500 [Actinobacteria bacterium OK006]|nr:hypothetical protein OK006_5500 [Actinobacteria bacterium OK006]